MDPSVAVKRPACRRALLGPDLPVLLPSMRLKFEKMQGIGNDFVVIAGAHALSALSPEVVRRISDRRFGIGCDQVLVAAAPTLDGADVAMKIFNADGSTARQCGNGIRCFARYVRDLGMVEADPIRVETDGGIVEAYFVENGEVRVNMGVPAFEPGAVPIGVADRARQYTLHLKREQVTIGAVSMGNPHVVLSVEDAGRAPVGGLGPEIQAHSWFPEGVNVGFMQILRRDHIRLRVYERGAGETLACGTGACAAAAVGVDQGVLDNEVRVTLNGGSLTVEWAGEGAPVWMTGPAADVFEGEIDV